MIFLLAPPREGRRTAGYEPDDEAIHFYSRPHGRGDVYYADSKHGAAYISTRAPTGGATRCPARADWWMDYFHSRPHGRGDGISSSRTTPHL